MKTGDKEFISSKKMTIAYALVFFLLSFDRLLKILAKNFLINKPIELTQHLHLNYFLNKNISFSLPISGLLAVILISVITLLVIYLGFWSIKHQQKISGLLLTIMGLASISNLFDRFFYQGVIDYLDVANFTVLNIPDIIISSTSFLLILKTLTKK